MTVLLSDSQRFVNNMDHSLNEQLLRVDSKRKRVSWVSRWLKRFTGSGVLIDGDQTYDVKARIMWIGLDRNKQEEEKEKSSLSE